MPNQKISGAIGSVCQAVAQEPLSYFSEADLQAMLYRELRSRYLKKYSTSVVKSGTNPNGETFKTPIVHREYAARNRSRFDLVVFNKKQIKSIDGFDLYKRSGKARHPITPDYAIELGTEKSKQTGKHAMSDFKKLRQAEKRGFLIHIFRDGTQSPKSSERGKKTEALTIREFRKAISDVYCEALMFNEDHISRVIVIALLLPRPKSDQSIARRCQLFDPCGCRLNKDLPEPRKVSRNKDWYEIDLNKVAAQVESLCNSPNRTPKSLKLNTA